MVRSHLLFLCPAIVLTMAACSPKEALQVENPLKKEVTITATSANETKTTLSSNQIIWTVKDRVSVLSEGNNDSFTLTAGAGTTTGTFSGYLAEAAQYTCLYPQQENAELSGSNIKFEIPAVQRWANGSFYGTNVSVASYDSNSTNIIFRNVCGLIQFDLTGIGTVSEIRVTGTNGESLCGSYSCPVSTIGTNDQALTAVSGSASVTIDCGSGVALNRATPTSFVAVVAPGAFAKGLTVTITGKDGETQEFKTSENNTIVRSGRIIMPVKDVEFTESFTLTNPVISAYLNHADDYDTSDYTYTKVKEYVKTTTDYRKDQPSPVTVTWEAADASAINVVVSESADYADAFTFSVTKPSDTSYDIYNLIPGRKYYYKVVATKNGVQSTAKEGSFNTLGHLRMIRCNSADNIRDLGGWESEVFTRADGTPKTVRYGKIYRGANVDGITKSDRRMMTGPLVGITYDFELRTTTMTSSPFGLDAYYDASHGLDNIFYQNIKDSDRYAKMFMTIVKRLQEGNTIYFHCQAGADRTGTLAFVLEGVLGLKENDLVKDYELTSFGWHGNRTRTTEYYNFSGMMSAIKGYSGDTLQAKFRSNLISWGVPEETIDWYINYMLE